MKPRALVAAALALAGCGGGSAHARPPDAGPEHAGFPLVVVSDVDLPGGATRMDYQDVDAAHGLLIIAHMGDSEVLAVDLADGHVRGRIPGIATARGVLAGDAGRIFATAAASDELVTIDAETLTETGRVATGNGPDGLGWDSTHRIVAVSDQRDGAVSLVADAGSGSRRQVPVGSETGNVVYDAGRGVFWVTVVGPTSPDRLVPVDPVAATAGTAIELPGCEGAHGLRLHPDGQSAFVACESNDRLVRVALDGAHAVVHESVGAGPDVLAIDPGLGWLYVAAESGDLTVLDIAQPGLVVIDRESPGPGAHTVAVDPATHRVFLPLSQGPKLRIMRPAL